VSGAGFASDGPVEVWLESTPVLLGSVTANANGAFTQSFVLPLGTVAGQHHVVLRGLDTSGNAAEVSLVVAVSGSVAGAVASALPTTGGHAIEAQLALGAVLIVAGAAIAMLARRRSHAELTLL
jgi:LPXTG-motif cell wall-anchored protein